MSNDRSCGEALVSLLEDHGVDIVFGIPGVHTLELYRGLVGSSIRHVLVRHEQGAGFMADGYARASGKPGVCFLITGPGVTNAATPIAQAYSDSVPMLVISSVNHVESLGKGWGELHELTDQRASTAPYTGFSATVYRPEDAHRLLNKAFSYFGSERPRPVHIEVPIDIFVERVEEDWPAIAPTSKPGPDPEKIRRVADLVKTAQHPALVLGGGAQRAAEACKALAEKMGALCVMTSAGNGTLPGSHPQNVGSALQEPKAIELLSSCDLVLAIGTELSMNETWDQALRFDGKLVRVDIDPDKLNDLYPADIGVQSDARLFAEALLNDLEEQVRDERHEWAEETAASIKRSMLDGMSEKERMFKAILDRLRRAVPDDSIFVGDMTEISYFAYRYLSFEKPGQFFNPRGYGTLGYALPAAIGAQLACPDKKVISLAGDGGFLYTLQEMATAADEKLPIIQILWNNRALGEIRSGFQSRGIEPIAVLPTPPDFQALAKAFGWQSHLVQDGEALDKALAEASVAEGPTVIEIDGPGDY